ncbi:hypothetical protein GGF41_004262, partial [Coemansia sp. RSA 2531]
SLFEFCAAKRLIFWLVAIETCTIYTGYWALTFYVGTNAKHLGGTLRDGSNLLLVLNAGSVVGRVMAGVIADRFGCINTLLISIMLTVVIEMPLWMTAKTITPLYVLCALYGLISPSFISINPVIIGRHFDMDVLASVMGMTNLFGGLGVLAGNLAQGAIFDKYDKREQFTYTIIFSGMFILLAGIVTFVMRVHVAVHILLLTVDRILDRRLCLIHATLIGCPLATKGVANLLFDFTAKVLDFIAGLVHSGLALLGGMLCGVLSALHLLLT